MENNNINNELEQMRQQMQMLQDKLDKQELVNERMIITSMKGKMSWIKKYIYFEFAMIPVLGILWMDMKFAFDLSWGSVLFFMVAASIDVYYDYKINISSMKEDDYARNNLIGTMQKLVAMKHQRFLQMAITIPLIIAWLGWVGYEMYQNLPLAENDFMSGMFQGGLFGGAIGAVFGLAIAFRIYFKMQKTNDDIIRDIEELQRED